MELSERIASKVADIELSMDDAGDLLLLASEVTQLESSLAEAKAELAGNALMDAEAESFISGQELVPIGTLEEIERLKTYAMLLEGNSYSLSDMEIKEVLGLSQTMMEWLIPYEHRKILAAGKDDG